MIPADINLPSIGAGVSGKGPLMAQINGSDEYRTILRVDIADSANPDRKMSDKIAMHLGMYEVLKKAIEEAGVDYDSCVVEDRGDGVLIFLPPNTARSVVADRLLDRIVAALRRYNSTRTRQAQFKLRVAVNSGDVCNDGNGWVGAAIDLVSRILDAPQAKERLAQSGSLVAFIPSAQFFSEVIADDAGLVPWAYERIDVLVKKFEGIAYLRVFGDFDLESQGVRSKGWVTRLRRRR